MARDEVDIRFTLEHWRLIMMDLADEPHEEVIRLADCEKSVAWLESTMAMAVAEKQVLRFNFTHLSILEPDEAK